LNRESHAVLARWAADCAERVLYLYTHSSKDKDSRLKDALSIGRKWANGEVKTGVAMAAARSAHAAAREAEDKAAIAAARAVGHAVGTAHAADHSMGALLYSMKALEAAGNSSDAEFESQIAKLPDHLRDLVASGVILRWKKSGIKKAQ